MATNEDADTVNADTVNADTVNADTVNADTVEVLHAHAKLTISLRVTGVRADGYHLIDAEMVALDLADRVEVKHRAGAASTDRSTSTRPSISTELSIVGPYAEGVPTDHTNLVARALHLAGRRAAVTIDKQIPHGGGLGGGSTDAAAVLRWAGFDDLVAASRIGADIPFCMVGGRAQVTGIGEIVTPLPYQLRTFTLVIPPLQVSTPQVYRAFDELSRDAGLNTGPTSGPNDLEPAAIAVEPALARWRDRITEVSGQVPVLAGSGATWFVHGEHGNALAALGNEGAQVLEATTVTGFAETTTATTN